MEHGCRIMECDICSEHFDGAERVPKSLPCGHTACLHCLRRLPDKRCPTCRQDFNGPPDGLPTNFTVLRFVEGRRMDSTPRGWCSDCLAAATPRCWEDHDVLSVRSALRRQLQGALPQAAEQLQGLQDQCRDEQVLPALTLLTGESWDVSLRSGGRELTGTLRNTEEPLTKALWLLLAERVALTEDRDVAGDPPPAAAAAPSTAAPTRGQPPAEAWPAREMDMSLVHNTVEAKVAALQDAPGVTRLHCVCCIWDPVWSLELLLRAAPSVEQLSLYEPGHDHLRALHAMPRLRRLHVRYDVDATLPHDDPLVLPALPPGHAGLQWLRVVNLPYATLQSLLKAHCHTLEELQLTVGTRDAVEWPWSCDDLDLLLAPCGLRALRVLVLDRVSQHCLEDRCDEQRAQLWRVLPGVNVQCTSCHRVTAEHF